jgi:PII-like signaling protein
MIEKGPAKKVTIWVNEDTPHHKVKLWLAVFEYLQHKKVAGASVTRTQMSFGDRQLIHRADAAETPDYAYRIEFVEKADRVDEVLPTLYDMVVDGLIEVQDTTVIKDVNRSKPSADASPVLARHQGKAKMMRIFHGERDKWHGEALYDAIVKRLRMMDVAGATVYRGILGYGRKGEPHRPNLLHISEDMPIMITVIDSETKITEAVAAMEEMLGDGLIVVSDVDVIRLVHSNPKEAADAEPSNS